MREERRWTRPCVRVRECARAWNGWVFGWIGQGWCVPAEGSVGTLVRRRAGRRRLSSLISRPHPSPPTLSVARSSHVRAGKRRDACRRLHSAGPDAHQVVRSRSSRTVGSHRRYSLLPFPFPSPPLSLILSRSYFSPSHSLTHPHFLSLSHSLVYLALSFFLSLSLSPSLSLFFFLYLFLLFLSLSHTFVSVIHTHTHVHTHMRGRAHDHDIRIRLYERCRSCGRVRLRGDVVSVEADIRDGLSEVRGEVEREGSRFSDRPRPSSHGSARGRRRRFYTTRRAQ